MFRLSIDTNATDREFPLSCFGGVQLVRLAEEASGPALLRPLRLMVDWRRIRRAYLQWLEVVCEQVHVGGEGEGG